MFSEKLPVVDMVRYEVANRNRHSICWNKSVSKYVHGP